MLDAVLADSQLALCREQSGGQDCSETENGPKERCSIPEQLRDRAEDITKVFEKINYCIHAHSIPELAARGKIT